MSQYTINIGAIPNDGTGDPLRTAFNETNLNFNQVFAAGPVLSNIQIANNTILTTNTNGNLVLAPNGTAVVQSNVSIVPNLANLRNLGSSTQRWATVYTQYLNVSAGTSINGDLSVTGNLTVSGNIIQLGNIVTDSLTIQLANTASNTSAANGSGITVGASDDIATILYNSTGNTWTTNIGISSVGNITAPYFIGNGSQLTGLPAGYANANAVAYGESGWAGNIIPSGNAVYSLGNSTNQWNDLYVSNATIYMNNIPVSLTAGNVLTVNGQAVLSNDSNATITTTGNITADYFIGDGSLLTGISGGSNTGNVTFSDNTVIGTGDQYGYSGLFLAPGPNSVGNLQYLQVRGGDNPTHIHFDTGNNAYYDQYVGNDNKFVKLEAGATGNIVIGTDDNVGNLYNWTFNNDGTLTFPDNSGSGWPVNTQRFGMGNIGAWLDGQWTIGEFSGNGVSGTVGIRIDPAIEGNTGITIPSQAGSTTQPVSIYNTGGGGIELYTGANNWEFNADGTTTFPDNTIQPLAGNDITLASGTGLTRNVGLLVFEFGVGAKLAMSPGFVVGTNQFTIEAFIKCPLFDSRQAIVACSTPGSGGFSLDILDENTINIDSDGVSGLNYSLATALTPNVWHYIAVVRDGSGLQQVFVDGIASTTTLAVNPQDYAGTTDSLGDFNTGNWSFNGYMSQIRAVIGQAIYDPNAATIPVPTQALTDVTGTQLLLDVYTPSTALVDSSGTQTFVNTGPVYFDYGGPVTYVGTAANVVISSGTNSWVYQPNGQIIFPTLTVDLHNGGNQSGQTLQFGNVGQQAFITGPTPVVNTNAERLIIQGQRGLGTGEGGDVYVWAGDAENNGGDIKIYAGDADTAGRGGNIHIAGGRGTTDAGEITLIGGQNDGGVGAYVGLTGGRGSSTGGAVSLNGGYGDVTGGDINIIGGIGGNGLGSYGNVGISAGSSSWAFDNTGNLTTPQGGYIGAAGVKGDGTMLTGGTGQIASLTSFYADAPGIYAGCFTANPDGTVNITTYGNGTGIDGQWIFSGANLTVPGEGIIQSVNDTVILQSLNTTSGNANSVYLGTSGGLGFNDQEIGGNWLEIFRLGIDPQLATTGNLLIRTDSSNTAPAWTFDNTGNLTVPGNLNGSGASPAPSINGFASINSISVSASGNITGGNIVTAGSGGDITMSGGNITGTANISAGNVNLTGNISLNGGYINGGTATVVTDGINSISLSLGAQMDVYAFPFTVSPTRGQLTISGITTPSQANGTWYYQSVNSNTYQLYTDSTYSTLVDASGWSAYTGGGSVAITLQSPAANIVVNSNGFLTTFVNNGQLNLPGSLTAVGDFGTDGDVYANIINASIAVTTPVPLANLAAVAGGRAFVNNGNLVAAGNFGSEIGAGGSNVVPVWSDGANWYIG